MTAPCEAQAVTCVLYTAHRTGGNSEEILSPEAESHINIIINIMNPCDQIAPRTQKQARRDARRAMTNRCQRQRILYGTVYPFYALCIKPYDILPDLCFILLPRPRASSASRSFSSRGTMLRNSGRRCGSWLHISLNSALRSDGQFCLIAGRAPRSTAGRKTSGV